MQSKANATQKPRGTLERQVLELIRVHNVGPVTLCVVVRDSEEHRLRARTRENERRDFSQSSFFAYALVRPGSPLSDKLFAEAIKAAGGSVPVADIPAIVKRVNETPIAQGQGASFAEALAALHGALAKQDAPIDSWGLRERRRAAREPQLRRTRLAKIARTARRPRRKRAS